MEERAQKAIAARLAEVAMRRVGAKDPIDLLGHIVEAEAAVQNLASLGDIGFEQLAEIAANAPEDLVRLRAQLALSEGLTRERHRPHNPSLPGSELPA